MLHSKTLMLNTGSGEILIWDLDNDLVNDLMTDQMADNIRDVLLIYHHRLDAMGDRSGIARLRENLVDFIWDFAYDEFEDNESFITLAKCTEPDLIQSVHGCLVYCMDNRY
jgi:hypothetical protein